MPDKETKDEEFAGKLEKFTDRFPTTEDYEAFSDYTTAVNEGVDADDLKEMRESATDDLTELRDTLKQNVEQIDELLKFAADNFKEED